MTCNQKKYRKNESAITGGSTSQNNQTKRLNNLIKRGVVNIPEWMVNIPEWMVNIKQKGGSTWNRIYICNGNGLFQAKIDLKTEKLTTAIQKFLDKREPGWPEWMVGGIEVPFVIIREGTYLTFFSTWTRGYEVGLLKSKNPLGPWELVSTDPIFGTRKKGYRSEMAASCGYADLRFQDKEDPYQESGHNALFAGPDGHSGIHVAIICMKKDPILSAKLLNLGNICRN